MLRSRLSDTLPPLAWVAALQAGRKDVTVRHGHRVETRDRWICEAVWDGDFQAGGFDRTPLIFGSGIRVRDEGVHFVSAGTTVDRLWVWAGDDGREWWVSNGLVHLLGTVGARPLESHHRYVADLQTIVDGLGAYRRALPVTRGRLEVVYFEDLLWDGDGLSRTSKPELGRDFASFDDYRSFLSRAALALAANARSPARAQPVHLLTSVSSGYDSPAASVIAREMGCDRAVTIQRARAIIPRSDSGREIGEALGLKVSTYDRDHAIGDAELRFWAATGNAQDVNLGVFDYPKPVCLFLTGFHGDKVWTTEDHDVSRDIVRSDTTGLGFTEDRLFRSVLHCPLPYWGARKMDQIHGITRSPEMERWRLHNDYDRPIPRRIVEEAGIPRQAFGQHKSATSSERRLLPYTPELRRDFAVYVVENGGRISPLPLSRLRAGLERYLTSVREKWPRLRGYLPDVGPEVPPLHFHWAVDRLIDRGVP